MNDRPRLTLAVLRRLRAALSRAAALEVAEGRAPFDAGPADWAQAAAWLDLEIERREIRSSARRTRTSLAKRKRDAERRKRARAAHADAWDPHL